MSERSPALRVVSLAPNVTEIIVAAGGAERLVGTDDYSDHPASVRALPKVGGVEPSLERIVELRPDLVVASASTAHPQIESALTPHGIGYVRLETERLDDVAKAIEKAGRLVGADGSTAASRFRRALEAERRDRERAPRILFVVWPDPLYVAGRETFADDLYHLVGGENAVPADVTGWPQFSIEMLLDDPPDLILFPDESVNRSQFDDLAGRHPAWRAVIRDMKIPLVSVDEDEFTRPGPRLVEAARALAAILDRVEGGVTGQ